MPYRVRVKTLINHTTQGVGLFSSPKTSATSFNSLSDCVVTLFAPDSIDRLMYFEFLLKVKEEYLDIVALVDVQP